MMMRVVIRPRMGSVIGSQTCNRLYFSTEATSPVNIHKDGNDPVLKTNEEYPEWMHTIHQPLKTFGQLERMEKLDMEDEDRFIKLINRQRIKARNNKS